MKFNSLSLVFRSFIFVAARFPEGFGRRSPFLVMEMLLYGSGCAFCMGFCTGYREFFSPFWVLRFFGLSLFLCPLSTPPIAPTDCVFR